MFYCLEIEIYEIYEGNQNYDRNQDNSIQGQMHEIEIENMHT